MRYRIHLPILVVIVCLPQISLVQLVVRATNRIREGKRVLSFGCKTKFHYFLDLPRIILLKLGFR